MLLGVLIIAFIFQGFTFIRQVNLSSVVQFGFTLIYLACLLASQLFLIIIFRKIADNSPARAESISEREACRISLTSEDASSNSVLLTEDKSNSDP